MHSAKFDDATEQDADTQQYTKHAQQHYPSTGIILFTTFWARQRHFHASDSLIYLSLELWKNPCCTRAAVLSY